MADVGSVHFVKGAHDVLVPQPSADPHDPLVCFQRLTRTALNLTKA